METNIETPEILKIKYPWSTTTIVLITVFFSFLPGSILYSMNFKRLGYTGKYYPTLLMNIVTFIIIFYLSLTTKIPTFFFIIVNIAYAIHFYKGQGTLYKKHLKSGGKKGSLTFPLIISIAFICFVIIVSYGYGSLQVSKYDKALDLITIGNYSEAEVLLKEYQKYDSKEPAIYYYLAVIYYETKRNDMALNAIKKYLSFTPDDEDAIEFLEDIKRDMK